MLAPKIFKFGSVTDGNASMKDVLGGKGANLAEMSSLGLPVPPGFTIPCDASVFYNDLFAEARTKFLGLVQESVQSGLDYLTIKKKLPLLSVRSGARVSMPGMMDTILNVGITSETLPYWIKKLGAVAALDSQRRLIQMYSSVALGVDMKLFEEALHSLKQEVGVTLDSELNEDQLNRLIKRYLKIVSDAGAVFPDTVIEQVMGAVAAVFNSWNNPRAIEYRKINSIPDDWGTAVTVQSMVFGNLNNDSCTGVLFSRNPSTGEALITGEYLVNAQGEDVVAGIRTPESIFTLPEWDLAMSTQLFEIVAKLEAHYRDMQDIEFTVEDSKLYILQTRNGKRSAMAAFQIAYDLVAEGLITKEVASSRVTSAQLFSVMQDSIDPSFKKAPTFTGIAAGGGVVSGVAMFTADSATNCKVPCILVTKETDPDDIGGMNASVGILTATGGLTSHAAVVARGMNKSCVVGSTALSFSVGIVSAYVNGIKFFEEGDKLTIDGATGNVWVKEDVPLITGGASKVVRTVVAWISNVKTSSRIEITSGMGPSQIADILQSDDSDEIHIDAMMMFPVEYTNDFDTLRAKVVSLGSAMATSKATYFVLDMSGKSTHYSAPDLAFDFMFGLDRTQEKKAYVATVNTILTWDESVRTRVTVVLPDDLDQSLRSLMKSAGFKLSGTVSTFADLIDQSGPMKISDSVIQQVFGGSEAYQVALNAIEKLQGKSVHKPLPVPAYWYEPIVKAA
jgi:pyruvate,orthophosphate dikinase